MACTSETAFTNSLMAEGLCMMIKVHMLLLRVSDNRCRIIIMTTQVFLDITKNPIILSLLMKQYIAIMKRYFKLLWCMNLEHVPASEYSK